MGVLDGLEPAVPFHFFEEISQIPRPSYHEKQISDYLVCFAKERGLEHYQDELGNVIMIKEATEGYEAEEPIILQGHMDMVCEKEPDCPKDMMTEGLELEVQGDYISAKGTTLGGDDGVAVAYALALLDSETLKHPRLEFVCTVSEEVGMDGARGIDVSMLKGHLLLNMDSEVEGEVLAACAGGGDAEIVCPIQREAQTGSRYRICIQGATGGHSGTEIDKGRCNAALILADLVGVLCQKEPSLRLVFFAGGSKDNAIPAHAECELLVFGENAFSTGSSLEQAFQKKSEALRKEYAQSDAELSIALEETTGVDEKATAVEKHPLTREATRKVLTLMLSLPNGVQRMSRNVENLVETSLNMGVSNLEEEQLVLRYAIRSSVSEAFDNLKNRLQWIAEGQGAACSFAGEYPAWEWVEQSALRDKMVRLYREMFGKELKVSAIHAGVECGLLAGKISNLDAISMGPDILDIHTYKERLSVSSFARMYQYIEKIIEMK